MLSQAQAAEHETILLEKIDILKSITNNFVSQFSAKLSQLRIEAVGEANSFAKAQEIWSLEKASLEAEVETLRATHQAQEERANVAHKAYQVCRKDRDDVYKAGAIWAQQVAEVRQIADKAVLGHKAAEQASMAALKDAEDLRKRMHSQLCGAELLVNEQAEKVKEEAKKVVKLQERLARSGKAKAAVDKGKEEMQAKLSASAQTASAAERRLVEVEGAIGEQQRLLKESALREVELQRKVEALHKAREVTYAEQDVTQFLGQAEDAQAAAEQGWHEAKQHVDILLAYIAANNLEVPDCHTQFYKDAEAILPTSQQICASSSVTPPPVTNQQTTDQAIASFDSASGTEMLPEVASTGVGHMPEVAGCGSAEDVAVNDPGAGFEDVKARRKPKCVTPPLDEAQSGRRPSRAHSVAKPSGAAMVLVVPRPASLNSSMKTSRRGDQMSRHNGGNAAAERGRTRAAYGRTDSSGGYSQSRSERGGFREGRGGGRGRVNTSRVLEVPRQSLRTDATA